MNLASIFCTTALTLATVTLLGCQPQPEAPAITTARWYTSEQVAIGHELFQAHCASCHGDRAQGLAEDWRKLDDNGNYPPPPLNGTAHAWHHPKIILEETITNGGAAVGGVMPGFGSELAADEIAATIAYFQSLWSDETYARWSEMDSR